ncbi:hypothetical protein Rumeso_00641 [Rubellimicrobium mesophilum DSM 19309]|uniref:Copper resistance protein CopC n=1 Tax=Rubellimicrobium mesophilum DSM 19309 TaxID=442562 RepID=A0A017HVY2_9RHOB|nr:CopD family protein [Rubellimicrobium mesophilum]EYD77914.1 hypothetical protein Rumeso_00641 [Rubellimicrobium mesophilum DSM 19309]
MAVRILGSLVLMLLLLGAAGSARAHAVVTGTEPLDGTVLAGPPSEVVIGFNEPVALIRAQVLGPDGQDVLEPDGGRAGEDGLHLDLPEGLARGTYTVSYHVVSLDGHPVAGSLVFSIGAASASGSQVEDDSAGWRWSFVAARVLLYLGLFGAAGGVAYALLVRPLEPLREEVRRIGSAAALVGLAAAVMALGLQGGLLLGGPPVILADPVTWAAGLSSTFGRAALCAMLGLALVWAGSRVRRTRGADLLAASGAVVALASFGLSGHVVTAGPGGLTIPPLLIHSTLAAFWVGSLLPLLRALAVPAEGTAPTVQRFSRQAILAVPVLLLAGLVLAWIQVRRPGALATTEYGRILLLKVVLVGALLGLAALNRLSLTPALARHIPGAGRRLGWSIRAEIALVVPILAATAALGTTPPPRALLAQGAPADLHAHEEHGHMRSERRLTLSADGFVAEVALAPGRIGPNGVSIALRDPRGRDLDVPEVTLRLSNAGKGIAPLVRPAERTGPGLWHVADLHLAVPGTWTLELDVLVSDFERQTATADLTVE